MGSGGRGLGLAKARLLVRTLRADGRTDAAGHGGRTRGDDCRCARGGDEAAQQQDANVATPVYLGFLACDLDFMLVARLVVG